MNSLMKIETTANVVIILLAVSLAILLSKNYFVGSAAKAESILGHQISIPGIEFTHTARTVIIALHPDCKFCLESARFYERLVTASANNPDVQLIAAFQKDGEQASEFLNKLNPSFTQTKTISFRDLKITATPTILEINRDGVVERIKQGKLDSDGENELLVKLSR